VKWEIICKSKRKGALGVKDTRKMNIRLLCKMVVEAKKKIIRAKYPQNRGVGSVSHRLNDSPVWTGLLKIRHTPSVPKRMSF
jgi:hypothetical protein